MHIVKSILRGLLALFYALSLVLLMLVGPLVIVFGTSAQLKTSLETSKIYDNLATNIVDSMTSGNSDPNMPNQDNSAFGDPAVKDAAQKALTPVFLQKSSESIIDGMYGWLLGKTPQPEFKIDISGVKQTFTKSVGDYAVNRASTLPACTNAQLSQIDTNNIDPLTVACIPNNFDIASLRTLVSNQLDRPDPNNKDNLLQQSVITPETLPGDDQGKTPIQNLTENAKQAPDMFHFVTILPWIYATVAVASAGLLLILHDGKRRGLRNLAISTLALGVFALLDILLFNVAYDKLTGPNGVVSGVDTSLQTPTIELIHSLGSAFNNKLLIFGVAYIVIGTVTLMILYFTKPKDTTSKVTPIKSK